MTLISRSSLSRWLAPGLILVLAALWLLALSAPAHAAKRPPTRSHRTQAGPRVPQGFMGTVLGDPLFPSLATTPALGTQMDSMVSSGVESVRVVFDWSVAQPYKDWSQVPASQAGDFTTDGVDDVPTSWAAMDDLVAAAAQRHLSVLPVILNAPSWAGHMANGASVAIPRSDAAFAAFCKALVLRYGRGGTYWQSLSPIVPITSWQIWNEPNLSGFWSKQPFARSYVGLLRAARTAIKSVDPKAQIVLAGLANYSWSALRSIYKIPGARGLFDVVGLHPYTKTPQGVVTILEYAREVMKAYGDANKPIIADEISWPSSKGKTVHDTGYDFATTEAGQARDVAAVIPLLAADRAKLRLRAVYYYTWATVEQRNGLAFTFAGLLKYVHSAFVRKPAFYAFKTAALAAEHCKAKGSVATQCARPS